MAAVVLLAGGFVGMLTSVVALILGSGLLAALGLWLVTGLGAAAMTGVFALLPRGMGQPAQA